VHFCPPRREGITSITPFQPQTHEKSPAWRRSNSLSSFRCDKVIDAADVRHARVIPACWGVGVALKVLIPRRLADRCYLAEALLWVSVCRFPLADGTRAPLDRSKWAEMDTRESPDHMALGVPLFLDTLTQNECERAGLPPNPDNEGRTWSESERTRGRGHDRIELEQELQASIALQKEREAWNQLRNRFLDSYKARLFVSLWAGDLAAFGKQFPREGLSHSAQDLNKRDRRWFVEARTPIHASFWDSTRIDWERSAAEGNGPPHAFIVVDTYNLLRIFPPSRNYPMNVMRVGDAYFLEESTDQQRNHPHDAANRKGAFPLAT
jgi:hypothetical protein